MGTKPAALVNKPQLDQRWHIPYAIWQKVEGGRNYTAGGPAELPFSEFYLWAQAYNYTNSELTCMWEDVHVIDTCWLREYGKKQEAKQKAQQPSPKTRR